MSADINDRIRALMKGQQGVMHDKTDCSPVYAIKGKVEFTCPECGRKTLQLVGGRQIMCNGLKLTKETK
jgi:hypothetical protein